MQIMKFLNEEPVELYDSIEDLLAEHPASKPVFQSSPVRVTW